MTSPSTQQARLAITAIFTVLALTLSTALAHHPVLVLAGTAAFEDELDTDEAVTKMGVSLTCEYGPVAVVLHKEGAGALGDAAVPGYAVDDLPENVFGDMDRNAAAEWVGIATAYPGGFTFTIDDTSSARLIAAAMASLQNGGCTIADHGRTRNGFGYSSGGVDYRAVFSATEGGTLVYLGH
jgi:hypothetical protein